jgi:predicted nucleotidyltransferase
VVDPAFASPGVPAMSLRVAVEKAVLRASHADRRIVSWSQYDLGVVNTLRDDEPSLVARFEDRYANALSVARRWRNRCYGGVKPPSGRLVGYLALIGYPVPNDAAAGDVGETIRVLRRRLDRGLPLTASQQARWERLVEHNRYDCAGMRSVCLKATQELEAAAG